MTLDLTQDFFSLFGLKRKFTIDSLALKDRYQDFQRALHPDRFVNASDRERRLAIQGVTHVNEGFAKLRDPLTRAQYLLELNGVDQAASRTKLTGEFLMEQMELREQLADVASAKDPWATLQHFMSEISQRVRRYTDQLTTLLDNPDADQLLVAEVVVLELQFLRKLQQEAELLEEQLAEAL